MVGLQGSGKTTTTAKIARRLVDRDKRKVLLASLDTRRPAAMEQLAILGQAGRRREPADRRRPVGGADRPARHGCGPARRLRRGHARHRRPHHARRGADGGGGRGQGRHQPARGAPRRRRAHRPGRGQHRPRLRRAPRRHRHRAHPHGRRFARRRGALDARRHRQADQARRHRREGRRAGGVPPLPRRQPHPRHGRHRLARREGGRDHRPRAGAPHRGEDAQGQVRPRRPVDAARPDGEDGRHRRPDGHAAGHGRR